MRRDAGRLGGRGSNVGRVAGTVGSWPTGTVVPRVAGWLTRKVVPRVAGMVDSWLSGTVVGRVAGMVGDNTDGCISGMLAEGNVSGIDEVWSRGERRNLVLLCILLMVW